MSETKDQYRRDREICHCEECQSGRYDPRDYMLYEEDFLRLDKERPFGLTGHLRAKNEALTVGECIESCIDFLDELIITYNDSEDETEEILQRYAQKYPDKIRLYHYKATVTPYTFFIRYKDLEKTLAFPEEDNIHNPANYYNFAYTKTRYKYYMKIDADQIYFADKIKSIKNFLYRMEPIGKIFSKLPNIIRRIINKVSKISTKISKKLSLSLYLLTNINNKKTFSLQLGGINLVRQGKDMVVSLEKDSIEDKKRCVFNGCVGDHTIWIPHSDIRCEHSKTRYYEIIRVPRGISFGFCWVHFGLVKNEIENKGESYTLLEFTNKSWKELMTNENFKENIGFNKTFTNFGEMWWDEDKKYITQEYYDKYFPSIVEYYRNNLLK